MAEKVFYETDKIEYIVEPESQEKFIKAISVPVHERLYNY
jgi:hypothetical protein